MSTVTTKVVQQIQQHDEVNEVSGKNETVVFSKNFQTKYDNANDPSESNNREHDSAKMRFDSENKSATATAIDRPYKLEIMWFNVIGYLVLHLAALYGVYLGFFEAKLLTTLWCVAIGYLSQLAVSMGAHRLYTHRTFKANKWIRLILVIVDTVSGQNCLWIWVRDHRQHHKFSDTHADPHNATRGFFFSHIGWLMVREHPEVIAKGKTIDMSDLNADPMVMFQKKYYKTLFIIFSVAIPIAIPCLLWNETVFNSFFISFITRLTVTLNFTWLINSAAHVYGMRPFSKDIRPTENWFVSILTLGEGWHNYHHSFPWDYRSTEFGQYFNLTTTVIDYCARNGWVYDLKSVSSELVRKQAMKKGDGSHPVYGKKQYSEEMEEKNLYVENSY